MGEIDFDIDKRHVYQTILFSNALNSNTLERLATTDGLNAPVYSVHDSKIFNRKLKQILDKLKLITRLKLQLIFFQLLIPWKIGFIAFYLLLNIFCRIFCWRRFGRIVQSVKLILFSKIWVEIFGKIKII